MTNSEHQNRASELNWALGQCINYVTTSAKLKHVKNLKDSDLLIATEKTALQHLLKNLEDNTAADFKLKKERKEILQLIQNISKTVTERAHETLANSENRKNL